MKNINPLGLFDDHFLLEKLTKLGDPLERLNVYINWNIFKAPLDSAFSEDLKDSSKGGRPPFDKLLMFKALLIQSLYNLSDDQLEYQIIDRSSFKRFLGLKKSDKVPDSKTFWVFREQLMENDVIIALFKTFNEILDSAGVLIVWQMVNYCEQDISMIFGFNLQQVMRVDRSEKLWLPGIFQWGSPEIQEILMG